jgi:ubiquitin-protein ligase
VGVFRLSVNVSPEYPFKPPEVRFLTRIFHLNVDHTTGDVCIAGW